MKLKNKLFWIFFIASFLNLFVSIYLTVVYNKTNINEWSFRISAFFTLFWLIMGMKIG